MIYKPKNYKICEIEKDDLYIKDFQKLRNILRDAKFSSKTNDVFKETITTIWYQYNNNIGFYENNVGYPEATYKEHLIELVDRCNYMLESDLKKYRKYVKKKIRFDIEGDWRSGRFILIMEK